MGFVTAGGRRVVGRCRRHDHEVWDEAADEWVCQRCANRRPVRRDAEGRALRWQGNGCSTSTTSPVRGSFRLMWRDSEHIALGWAGPNVLIALSVDPANQHITHAVSIPTVAVTRTAVLGRADKRVRKAVG